MNVPASVSSVEFENTYIPKGNNIIINILSLFSFIGARHLISDLYEHRSDIICNPMIKVIILFSVIFVNIKDIKISILIFFIYLFFIDSYITDRCNPEYIDNTKN